MLFIEVENLKGKNGETIVKELGMSGYTSDGVDVQQAFMFKPPYSDNEMSNVNRRCNSWITKNIHHIRWGEGFVPYEELDRILNMAVFHHSAIYTKGLEKAEFLSRIIGKTVQNLDEMNCPRHENINLPDPIMCTYNHVHNYCALKKCLKYRFWYHQATKNMNVSNIARYVHDP